MKSYFSDGEIIAQCSKVDFTSTTRLSDYEINRAKQLGAVAQQDKAESRSLVTAMLHPVAAHDSVETDTARRIDDINKTA